MELTDFASGIKKGRIVALRVEPERRGRGGARDRAEPELFALALAEADAEIAERDMLYAGEPVTAGFWIVSITWFNCVDQRRHVYIKEQPRPFYLVVNALLRVGNIPFERTSGDRYYLNDDTHAQRMGAL